MCMFCRSLFVLLYFFFWPLCFLFFFDIRILITPLVSSNSSYMLDIVVSLITHDKFCVRNDLNQLWVKDGDKVVDSSEISDATTPKGITRYTNKAYSFSSAGYNLSERGIHWLYETNQTTTRHQNCNDVRMTTRLIIHNERQLGYQV